MISVHRSESEEHIGATYGARQTRNLVWICRVQHVRVRGVRPFRSRRRHEKEPTRAGRSRSPSPSHCSRAETRPSRVREQSYHCGFEWCARSLRGPRRRLARMLMAIRDTRPHVSRLLTRMHEQPIWRLARAHAPHEAAAVFRRARPLATSISRSTAWR